MGTMIAQTLYALVVADVVEDVEPDVVSAPILKVEQIFKVEVDPQLSSSSDTEGRTGF